VPASVSVPPSGRARIAIGATPGGVLRMIVGEGLATTLVSVAAGSMLGFGTAALLAASLPARRATRINPPNALCAE
jgi:hypothetical protein